MHFLACWARNTQNTVFKKHFRGVNFDLISRVAYRERSFEFSRRFAEISRDRKKRVDNQNARSLRKPRDASERSRERASKIKSTTRSFEWALPDFRASLFREENRRASANPRWRLTPWNFPLRPGRSTGGEASRVLPRSGKLPPPPPFSLFALFPSIFSSQRFSLPSSREDFSKSLHFPLEFCCFRVPAAWRVRPREPLCFYAFPSAGWTRARTYRRVRPLDE